MLLSRSLVNDMFPGGLNTAPGVGRILTDDASFTLPYLNSAFRTLQRKLRIGGVTFPVKEEILYNLTPIVTPSSDIFVYVDYNGYFDGTASHDSPALPGDLMQPYAVWEQNTSGASQNGWCLMGQPPDVFECLQGTSLGIWEWRSYGIYMPGATLTKNLKIKYLSGQPPINVPPQNFATTSINIADSTDALAYLVAKQYSIARGASDVSAFNEGFADAVTDMINEYVKRGQTKILVRGQYGSEIGPLLGTGTSIGGGGTPLNTDPTQPVVFIATAGQTQFILPTVPMGYIIWVRNQGVQNNPINYTIAGNVVTTTLPSNPGDVYEAIYQTA
jgi:hypothetical protein